MKGWGVAHNSEHRVTKCYRENEPWTALVVDDSVLWRDYRGDVDSFLSQTEAPSLPLDLK